MIKSIGKAIKLEWDIMIKEKMIFIVIFLIPLLTNLVLGYQFDKGQVNNIPLAIYDQDNSSLSRMVIQQFNENDMFKIVNYLDNSEDMKKMFDNSKTNVGMIIPKDFSKDVMELKSPTILMIYDGSHMPLAGAAKSKATEILLTLKTGAFIKLLQAKLNMPYDLAGKVALSIKFTNRTLYNPTGNYKYFLNIGFGTAIVQSGIALMAASTIRRNEIEKERFKRLGYLLGKIIFYSIIGFIALMTYIYIQNILFRVPIRGSINDVVLLNIVFAFAVSTFSIMISSWIKYSRIATVINALIFVPSTVMVGFTWPVLSMPRIYQVMSRYYPFSYYADNLRDMLLKGISLSSIYRDIVFLFKYTIILLLISIIGVMIIKPENYDMSSSQGKEGEQHVVS